MRRLSLLGLLVLAIPGSLRAQTLKAEPLNEGPPDTIAAPLREVVEGRGYRISLDGKPFADFWFRKVVPASAKPAGPSGSVRYPFLVEGEFLGVARYAAEGHDYRDQGIVPGLYTLRYGLRLDDGNHANVSPYMDYALLLPAAKDVALAPIPAKALQKTSSQAAGTTHPAILVLGDTPSNPSTPGEIKMDQEADTRGLLVPLTLKVAGEAAPSIQWIQLVISGISAG